MTTTVYSRLTDENYEEFYDKIQLLISETQKLGQFYI